MLAECAELRREVGEDGVHVGGSRQCALILWSGWLLGCCRRILWVADSLSRRHGCGAAGSYLARWRALFSRLLFLLMLRFAVRAHFLIARQRACGCDTERT